MIDFKTSTWNGFKRLDFKFKGRHAILICPEKAVDGNKWLYKTEYFDAFPDFEIQMIKRAYYLALLYNRTRWCPESDTDLRPLFCEFSNENFGLNKKCMLVGMSCGGMQAVYFAAKYPEYVAAMYIDAPVLNLLSCPYALGAAKENMREEFEAAIGITLPELLNYRKHPIDYKQQLLETNIPIFLVCGDSDTVVPYLENGKILSDFYKENGGNLTEIVKKNCDHHPHGLTDNTPLIEFTIKYY